MHQKKTTIDLCILCSASQNPVDWRLPAAGRGATIRLVASNGMETRKPNCLMMNRRVKYDCRKPQGSDDSRKNDLPNEEQRNTRY